MLPINPLLESVYQQLVPRLGSFPPPSVVMMDGGRRISVFAGAPRHLANNPDFYIYYFGTWESRQTRAVKRVVRPGDICFDIGANIGWYTLLLSELAGPSGQVHAFEPDPRAYAQLEQNLALNQHFAATRIHNVALGAAVGSHDLYTTPESLYSSFYDVHGGGKAPGAVSVETVDTYARSAGIDRIDFLKCDVEGAEFDVLRGARTVFRHRHGPPAMQLEVNPETARGAQYEAEDLLVWLQAEYGYQFFRVTLTGHLVRLESPAVAASRLWDIYCLVPEFHADRLAIALARS